MIDVPIYGMTILIVVLLLIYQGLSFLIDQIPHEPDAPDEERGS